MKLFEAPSATQLVLQTILARGGAFKAKYECLDEGEKTRFFVVANLDPATADTIILFTSTTKIAKRRKHHRGRADRVLVKLDPSTYDGVSEECVLDCESPIKRKKDDFLKGVENRGIHADNHSARRHHAEDCRCGQRGAHAVAC